MTGWEVERTPRAAVPARSGTPAGVCSHMPPPSQGAERRTERRARRTGMRWGLRALVIGGLAGAAWLLTGTAAQAADRDPAAEGAARGSSLIGSVRSGDVARPTVTGVLQAAAQPLESDRPAHRHSGAASLLTVPTRALARPVETVASSSARTTDLTGLRVDHVVRRIAGQLRLTGGPADSPLAPVTTPLVRTLRPVTGLLPHAAAPSLTAPRPTAVPAAHGVYTQRPIATPVAYRATPASTASPTGPAPSTVAMAGPAGARHAAAPAPIVARPHSASGSVAGTETFRETPRGGDGPAPVQVHFWAISGLLTSGSGGPTEGGSPACLPAAVAASSMAFHRLVEATDVEARRFDAEAPTVSPD
jgi:hypothetical protein